MSDCYACDSIRRRQIPEIMNDLIAVAAILALGGLLFFIGYSLTSLWLWLTEPDEEDP